MGRKKRAGKSGKRRNHEGTLYHRKDGRWYAQISLPNGKRKGFYHQDEQVALQWKQEALANLAKGLPLYDEQHTLGAYLADWIAGVSNVRRSSLAKYESLVRVHLLPSTLAQTPLTKLTRPQVGAFFKQKEQAGLAPATVRHLHTVLGRALREAMEAHLVPENVCQRLRVVQVPDREMLYLSREQVRGWLALLRAHNHRSYGLFALAVTTGMRQGELLGLHWKDVQLDGSAPALRVRVQSIEVREPGNYHSELAPLKTTRSKRRFKLGPDQVQVLRAHKARQELEKRMVGDAWENLGLVFPNRTGGLAGHSGVYQLFERWAKLANLPEGIRFHDLRHTAATLALESGETLKAVAAMLGDSEAVVMQFYLHVTPSMEESITATMDSLLSDSSAPLQYPLQSHDNSEADEG